MDAFALLCRAEGIIPAIESAHALAGALAVGRELGPDAVLVVNLSGRGDKDMDIAARWFGHGRRCGRPRGRDGGPVSGVTVAFEKAAAENRAALVGYLPAGFPTVDGAIAAARRDRGRGRRHHRDRAAVLRPADGRPGDPGGRAPRADRRRSGSPTCCGPSTAVAAAGVPVLVMTYWNPVDHYGVRAFARDLASAGGAGLITPDLTPEEAGRGCRRPPSSGWTRSSWSRRAPRTSGSS